MNPLEVSFVRLDPRGLLPERAHSGDAGLDLATIERVDLAPGARAVARTGLSVAIPAGHAGWVVPRSGHARRAGISIVNTPGLIDSGFRGEIEVMLVNHGTEPVSFDPGDRVAQLVVVQLPVVRVVEVEELEASERGAAGFGSSGR